MESKETVLSGKFPCRRVWIPAFAGMTAVGGVLFFPINSCCVAFLDSSFCGNDSRWGFGFFR
ncbi:hypothetical protein GC082_11955 [Neisseria meningitidis]|nr:hypothetical protein [Neisseria meningitidis]